MASRKRRCGEDGRGTRKKSKRDDEDESKLAESLPLAHAAPVPDAFPFPGMLRFFPCRTVNSPWRAGAFLCPFWTITKQLVSVDDALAFPHTPCTYTRSSICFVCCMSICQCSMAVLACGHGVCGRCYVFELPANSQGIVRCSRCETKHPIRAAELATNYAAAFFQLAISHPRWYDGHIYLCNWARASIYQRVATCATTNELHPAEVAKIVCTSSSFHHLSVVSDEGAYNAGCVDFTDCMTLTDQARLSERLCRIFPDHFVTLVCLAFNRRMEVEVGVKSTKLLVREVFAHRQAEECPMKRCFNTRIGDYHVLKLVAQFTGEKPYDYSKTTAATVVNEGVVHVYDGSMLI